MRRGEAAWSTVPLVAALVLVGLVASACGTGGDGDGDDGGGSGLAEARAEYEFPAAPEVPDGALDPEVAAAVDELVAAGAAGRVDDDALATVAASGDARLAWLISDLLRFLQVGADPERLVEAGQELVGVDLTADPAFDQSRWRSFTDHLIAWDLPAPPGYQAAKAELYLATEPRWQPFFADEEAAIDWRLVSWGGVLIDDRPLGTQEPCPAGCIPALDDPPLTPAEEGDWYPDDRIVFGVVAGGEAVALPKHQMEVHEMVNLTVGGQRLGIPYCTLCGAAQAYRTDVEVAGVDGPLVLRTSGLLSRSNKLMYELESGSAIDTFTGEALSGPLHDAEVQLEEVTVVATTWGAWKDEHPDTQILAEDGGLGRSYPDDPLGGRDDDGPIFPIGDADPRLPVQELVVGGLAPDGTPVAFPVVAAGQALDAGEAVEQHGVVAERSGDGLALRADGDEVTSHQAFWFAWSQFWPDTELWSPS